MTPLGHESPPGGAAATVKIDVTSDVVCPWCLIGTYRLERALASLGASDAVEVRYHPFLLQPDIAEGGADLAEYLRRKYGADPQQMFARVEAVAREAGIPLDFRKQPRSYPTVRAHTLLRLAGDRGTQRALAQALFSAYFLEGRNIGDIEELVAIAAPHGLSADEVCTTLADARELARTRAEADEAHTRGIRGVPYFVFNGERAFSGAQPEDVFREALRTVGMI